MAAFATCALKKEFMTGARRFNNQRGFSLMEMLVALGLFSMVMVSAPDIYLLASRSQRRALSMERAQSDARFAMEAITREIRGGSIDYGYYAESAASPVDDLALIASDGSELVFSRSTSTTASACPDAESVPCLLVSIDGSDPVSMTSRGISVSGLNFYVGPFDDPFAFDESIGDYGSNVQPHVTVSMTLRSVGGRDDDQSTVHLQTTATSRTYRR